MRLRNIVMRYSEMRELTQIPYIATQIGFNFGIYVQGLKYLVSWDEKKFRALGAQKPKVLIRIRNELSNDGLIYSKNIGPIFQETLSEAIGFFKTWNNQNYNLEKFID